MVFFTDLGQTFSHESPGFLSLFGLTPAELRLAAALANGIELKTFAANNGITEHTARAHLKSTMAKMGVHRQIDMVRLAFAGVLVQPSK